MTPTEESVSAICSRILGLENIAADDNLYDLGSDSHQAVLIAIDIERTFKVSLPLEVMESSARVSTLAAWIDKQTAERELSSTSAMVAKAGPAGDG